MSVFYINDRATVDAFLNKYEFNFKRIINSKNQIAELDISAFPTSLILNKNGIIKVVSGEITEYELDEVETTLEILL